MHTFVILDHLRFKNVPSGISHDAIAIEFSILLLLLSFCPENSTLVQVFTKIDLIYTFLSMTLLIKDLEYITLSPLGHLLPC